MNARCLINIYLHLITTSSFPEWPFDKSRIRPCMGDSKHNSVHSPLGGSPNPRAVFVHSPSRLLPSFCRDGGNYTQMQLLIAPLTPMSKKIVQHSFQVFKSLFAVQRLSDCESPDSCSLFRNVTATLRSEGPSLQDYDTGALIFCNSRGISVRLEDLMALAAGDGIVGRNEGSLLMFCFS